MGAVEQRTALLQTIWRRAFHDPKGEVRIHFKSAKEAKKVRFDLYNAVRGVKENPTLDPRLKEAAEGCSLAFDGDLTIVVKRKVVEDSLLEVAEALGVDLTEVRPAPKDRMEVEARESADRMRRLMEEAPPESPATAASGVNRFRTRGPNGERL